MKKSFWSSTNSGFWRLLTVIQTDRKLENEQEWIVLRIWSFLLLIIWILSWKHFLKLSKVPKVYKIFKGCKKLK